MSKVNKSDKDDLKSKAKSMILNHPEVMYNARGMFHNENGKTIIEERVPRGDLSEKDEIMPRNQGDLTEDDLRGLATHAASLIDDTLNQYDSRVAFEDALQKAIGSMDGGKYAGKVNASTFELIMNNMKSAVKSKAKSKKASEENIPETVSHKESSKEETMDKATITRELEATRKRLAALEVLAGCDKKEDGEESKEAGKDEKTCDKCKKTFGSSEGECPHCKDAGESKEAGKAEMIKCPDCGSKVLKATGYCLSCKKKIGGKKDDKKDDDKKDDKKDKKDKDASEKTAMSDIIASLDEIAGTLENQNTPELVKLAFQIDMVADVLEGKKEAATLEGDADERYMKEFFHAGARETDADEKKYMSEFNTDMTTELKDKYQKNQLGKNASVLPYKVVK